MPAARRTIVLGALALLAGSALLASKTPAAQGPDGQIELIRQILARQERDWNKGDLDGFCSGYWDSPELVFQSGGDKNVGFRAMRERYRKRYQAEGKSMGKVAFSDTEIQILGAGYEAALVRGRWALTMPDGKTPGGLFTLIFRDLPKVGWKIVHDHTSTAEPAAAPAAAPAPG